MSELLPVAGLAGAVLCLVGHLSGPVHRWGPQLLALSGMALMAGGGAVPGTCVVMAACVWSVVPACGDRRGRAAVIDLAAMTLLMSLMTGHPGSGRSHAHMAGMAGDPATGSAVLIVVVWLTARSGEIMFRRVSDSPPPSVDEAAPPARRTRAYRESGATLMIISMAAMLV